MKALCILAVAVLVLGLAGTGFATTLQCLGTESTGGGGTCGTQWVYRCTPTAAVDTLEIPTGDGNLASYTGICAPAGWTLAIVANTGLDHGAGKTNHGDVSPGSVGDCLYKMVWSGPAKVAVFEVGFNLDSSSSHDVAWTAREVTTASAANWADPVGLGTGPVHAPVPPVPTLTEWGMIGIVLLLLVAGTLFILRQRRSAATAA